MLLQRLKLDKDIGFNYDYMGAAEYENGATATGRLAIAQAFIDKTMNARTITFVEIHGLYRGPEIEVLAVGKPALLDALGDPAEIRVWKETFRTSDKNIVGWMNVQWENAEPLLLLRTNIDNLQERVDKFFADPIKFLQGGNVS